MILNKNGKILVYLFVISFVLHIPYVYFKEIEEKSIYIFSPMEVIVLLHSRVAL